mgnify:CR=1 FL=1
MVHKILLIIIVVILHAATGHGQLKGNGYAGIENKPAFTADKEVVISKAESKRLIAGKAYKNNVRYTVVLNKAVATLPARHEDKSSFMKPLLEQHGWKLIDWGSGNFEKGPRFTQLQFYKAGLYCFVFRKYSYAALKQNGNQLLVLTEEFEFVKEHK